jgi:hypothetical protein
MSDQTTEPITLVVHDSIQGHGAQITPEAQEADIHG